VEDLQEIMSEAPGGDNHGVATDAWVDESGAPRVTRRDLSHRLASLDQRGLETVGSRFGIVSGREEGGLVAHRGVLHPDEYVDTLALREDILAELGVTYPEFTGAYKSGRPAAEQRELREKIDARLLALSRAGTNLARLAEGLGVSEKLLDRALRRAGDVEVVPIVRDPAVTTTRPCFICEKPGRPRKRKSPDTPAHLRGTVVLCDDHYAAGFEAKKGNPAYWRFRDRLSIPKGAYA
jgi:hypothetical protein